MTTNFNNTPMTNDMFDNLLPSFGQTPKGPTLPTWNEGQKMFISDEYESAAGNRYYRGIRFCEKIAIVETVGLSKYGTYINGIEVYAFNGKDRRLIGKKQFPKEFYDTSFIKEQTYQMVTDYLMSEAKLMLCDEASTAAEMREKAKSVVDLCYRGPLDDGFIDVILNMLPLLGGPNGLIKT